MTHIPYFPFSMDPPKIQMGIKPLDVSQWIEIDDQFKNHVALKKKILSENQELVLQVDPAVSASCLELYEMLQTFLLANHPAKYSVKNDAFFVHATEESFPRTQTDAVSALKILSTWVQEDFAIMSPPPGVRLAAGTICFPSRWNLKEKFNRDSDGIHGPVPKFKETIAKPTSNFLERMTMDKPMWRMNWTIHDSDELFTPHPVPHKHNITVANVLDETFLRVERQTLRRMEKTGSVVFTIRTYVHRMRDVVNTPERKDLVKATLGMLDPEIAEYRGMKMFYNELKASLG